MQRQPCDEAADNAGLCLVHLFINLFVVVFFLLSGRAVGLCVQSASVLAAASQS